MEPQRYEPDDVETYINWARECLNDPAEAIARSMSQTLDAEELSSHHVPPEIEQVKQQTEADDDSKNEHVLRSPLYLACINLRSYLVTIVATSGTVLRSQNEGVDDVNHCQGSQTKCCYNSILSS